MKAPSFSSKRKEIILPILALDDVRDLRNFYPQGLVITLREPSLVKQHLANSTGLIWTALLINPCKKDYTGNWPENTYGDFLAWLGTKTPAEIFRSESGYFDDTEVGIFSGGLGKSVFLLIEKMLRKKGFRVTMI